MTESVNWRSRPIFISSTFKDMGAERDYLRNYVFPELEERLRKRRHFLEPIDLRWGVETASIDEEREKEMLVLKVCLDEIERSRPFLIALMGDRYGWIPPEERIKQAAYEKGYRNDVKQKSITALEIEYGVLSNPDQRKRSYFYFREPLPYQEMNEELAAQYSDEYAGNKEAGQRLIELKQRIRSNPFLNDRVRTYQACWNSSKQKVTNLETFGQMVLEDLWNDLQDDTEQFLTKEITWQDEERVMLDEFIENRTRTFTGREDILQELKNFALISDNEDAKKALCLTGESGSGKSAVFAKTFKNLQKENILLLANASNSGPRSNEINSILERWVDELCGFLKVKNNLPEKPSPEELDSYFRTLLLKAGEQKRVVVIIDAINQLEKSNRGLYMTWLPGFWPDNTRLICTTIPCQQSQSLLEKNYVEEILIPKLEPQDARNIALNICKKYHRELNPQVLQILMDKKRDDFTYAIANPLWISTAIEELNILDSDTLTLADKKYIGNPESCLLQLLMDTAQNMPPTPETLFPYIYKRAEKLFGTLFTQNVLSLIALSRNGWREKDVKVIVPRLTKDKWNTLTFASFKRHFRGHLIEIGQLGLFRFFHAQMVSAVTATYLQSEFKRQEVHNMAATYLLALPNGDPIRNEIMFHLLGTQAKNDLADYYGSVTNKTELKFASQTLAEFISKGNNKSTKDRINWLLSIINYKQSRLNRLVEIFQIDLNEHLEFIITLKEKEHYHYVLKEYIEHLVNRDPNNVDWQRALSISYNKLGKIYSSLGFLPEALKACKASLDIGEKLCELDSSNMIWKKDLSIFYDLLGEIYKAQGTFNLALRAYKSSFDILEKLTNQDIDNTNLQKDLAVSYNYIGDIFFAQESFTEARKAYESFLEITAKLIKQDPSKNGLQRNLSLCYEKLGNVFKAQGSLTEAKKQYMDSLNIRRTLAEQDPGNSELKRNLSVSFEKLGNIFLKQGSLDEAQKSYEASFDILEKIARNDPDNAGWQRDLSDSYKDLGEVYWEQGSLAEAKKVYMAALNIMEKLSVQDPENANWQRDLAVSYHKLGKIYLKQGCLSEAQKEQQISLDIAEKLAVKNPENISWQGDLFTSYNSLGDIYFEQGSFIQAHKAYEASCDILKRLAKKYPENTVWQTQLSLLYRNIGNVQSALGSLTQAQKAYEDALNIADKIACQDPDNNEKQINLWFSCWTMAEIYEKTGSIYAKNYWRKAFDILHHLKQQGLIITAQDEGIMSFMRQKISK